MQWTPRLKLYSFLFGGILNRSVEIGNSAENVFVSLFVDQYLAVSSFSLSLTSKLRLRESLFLSIFSGVSTTRVYRKILPDRQILPGNFRVFIGDNEEAVYMISF